MSAAALKAETKDIVIDEVFPHAPEAIWKALTSAELIGRWLMPPTGFEAVEGNTFTYQTKPGGHWDGVIHCRVLEVVPCRRLVYAWQGGDARNTGYGAPLDTVVTWSLTPVEAGTRIQLVHAGFVLPGNESAYTVMSGGWKKVVQQLDEISGEES
ncbi:SRPBCC domain-containing protein [Bradyrhizobium sp. INPA01-394B]|uniref:SRPBCC domain-containing protein n=1 Tax=Bradyrhizobium campsiandrae TaxID=1729892 RepID=A0ABR7ULD9_9BRAD|nr:SRPBCC domain-containing protein [Bradyrhizobium campsiandrae]MBC9875814.1 SRPBCC domain-containing protein [Bradyrhizobium campsiandrae]MBC9983983.1 SRPBCC domain-containing protein [Bradyrhizobium campsiandrae]